MKDNMKNQHYENLTKKQPEENVKIIKKTT